MDFGDSKKAEDLAEEEALLGELTWFSPNGLNIIELLLLDEDAIVLVGQSAYAMCMMKALALSMAKLFVALAVFLLVL